MIRIEVMTVSKYYTFDRKFETIEIIECPKLTPSIFRTLLVVMNDYIDLNTDCKAFFFHDQQSMPFDMITLSCCIGFSGRVRTELRRGSADILINYN